MRTKRGAQKHGMGNAVYEQQPNPPTFVSYPLNYKQKASFPRGVRVSAYTYKIRNCHNIIKITRAPIQTSQIFDK